MTVTVAMLSGILLSGCGGSSDEETSSSEKSGDSTITITIGKQQDENAGNYDDGDDINNNPMTRLTLEKLGIEVKTTLLGGDSSNYTTKLRLALTGSEELPDVFTVYDKQLMADLIESGKVKAIDEDIEKYMPDRLKEVYDEFPETYYPVTSDGKKYGLAVSPHVSEGQVMIIRQDWLDNLNLEAPTTLDEFEEVIRAFTEDDPDGNGQDDTYGFTYSGSSVYNTGWVSDPVTLFSANSGKYIPGVWQEDEDGNLVYGSIQEGNRATLERMAEWHSKGWIFQEAAATGAWDAMGQFTEGKAGIVLGCPWVVESVSDVTSVDENAKVVAYPNILQENGEHTYQEKSANDGWLMFNADFDNMEAFFEYYDWLMDAAFGTGDFIYGYIQDYDYDIVDGEVVFDTTLFDPPKTAAFASGKSTVLKNTPALDTALSSYAEVKSGVEPTTGDQIKAAAYFESSPEMANGYVIAYEQRDEYIYDLFNAAPTETMAKYWEQLETMEVQTYTDIIYGKEPIEAFDEFVEKWYSSGGEQITEEVNEWYQSVKND